MEQEKLILGKLNTICTTVNSICATVNTVLTTVNQRFDQAEEHMGRLEERIGRLEERMDKLEERMDMLEERVNILEAGLSQFRQETGLNFTEAQGERNYMFRVIQGMQTDICEIQYNYRSVTQSVDGIYTLLAEDQQSKSG